MSEHCDGSVVPKYKKSIHKRITFDGTHVEEVAWEEVGLICLGCKKTPCEEDTKKGLTLVD